MMAFRKEAASTGVTAQQQASDVTMLSLDTNLLPEAFASAFGLPSARVDHSNATRAGLPFEILPSAPSAGAPGQRQAAVNVGQQHRHGQRGSNAAKHVDAEAGRQSRPNEELPTLPVTYEHTDSANKTLHKPRVVWTDELHQRFLKAIEAAGSEEAAVPTVILKLMNVSGLNRDNVASHLQKHRLGLKRGRSRKRQAGAGAKPKSRRKGGNSACDLQQHTGTDTGAGGASARNFHDGGAEGAPQTGASADLNYRGQWQDQAGSNERKGSNQRDRGNDGSCDPNSGNGECSGRDRGAGGSDDGNGAGSDNRNSCLNDAQTHQQHSAPDCHDAHGGAADNAYAAAPNVFEAIHGLCTTAPSGRALPQHLQQALCHGGSAVGSTGDAKGSGSTPASGGNQSRVGSSRATAGSGNATAVGVARSNSPHSAQPLGAAAAAATPAVAAVAAAAAAAQALQPHADTVPAGAAAGSAHLPGSERPAPA